MVEEIEEHTRTSANSFHVPSYSFHYHLYPHSSPAQNNQPVQ